MNDLFNSCIELVTSYWLDRHITFLIELQMGLCPSVAIKQDES